MTARLPWAQEAPGSNPGAPTKLFKYLAERSISYRRITAELRRRGMLVNHKRVLRIMREDSLVSAHPGTLFGTNFNRDLEVYLNLASRMTLTGTNQLWVADITYIRLQREFVYLAVILDAFCTDIVRYTTQK
jgi:putative transposase